MDKTLIFAGKSKVMYENKENNYLMKFLDNVSAQGGLKTARVFGTGRLRLLMSEEIFKFLEEHGVKTHYLGKYDSDTLIVKKLDMFKLEIIPRNYAAGSACIRFPFVRGQKFNPPILKIDMKYGEDPMLNDDYIFALGLATPNELSEIKKIGKIVNNLMIKFFDDKGLTLVDYKFELGKDIEGNITIGDEISCDGMRVWDNTTKKSLDKDIFRYDWGNLLDGYYNLVSKIVPNCPDKEKFINVLDGKIED